MNTNKWKQLLPSFFPSFQNKVLTVFLSYFIFPCLYTFSCVVAEVNSELEQARGPNPWNTQLRRSSFLNVEAVVSSKLLCYFIKYKHMHIRKCLYCVLIVFYVDIRLLFSVFWWYRETTVGTHWKWMETRKTESTQCSSWNFWSVP